MKNIKNISHGGSRITGGEDADGYTTFYADVSSAIGYENPTEIARRIVACVNACEGIPTEMLELSGADMWKNLCENNEQRDSEFKALMRENERLNNGFFEMCGSDYAAKVDNDHLRAKVDFIQKAYDGCAARAKRCEEKNARLLEALKGVLEVANVRIDDPRIAKFDAARAAIAEAEK